MRRSGGRAAAALLALLLAGGAPARGEDRPALRAHPLSAEERSAIQVDGILSEAAWASADSIPNLTTIEPEEGGTPAGRTVVRVLMSPDEVIVGVRCHDDDPAGIVSYSQARDTELDEEDHVLIVLDTFGDNRSGYVFAVNPGGSRFDGIVTAQGEDVNSNWDAVWETATHTDAGGWSVEFSIPIKSLSFARGLSEWGFNLERRVERLQETSRWSGAKRDFEIFQTSQAGRLTGLPSFDLGVGLTVRPGLVAAGRRPEPGRLRTVVNEVSLDLSQKLGSNLAATVTVNTDFGETEADVRQTNLSRFDVLFPEQRSFFLEGADIFEFGMGLDLEDASLVPFFSRRIGIFVPEGEDEESGREIPLLLGGKLQGRIGETNLGAVVVTTDRDRVLDVPKATLGAVRIRQNVLDESSIGVIGTFGDPLNRKDSWLGGIDLTYRTSEFRGDKNLQAGVWGLATDRRGLTGDRHAYGGKIAYPNDLWDARVTWLEVGDGFQPSLAFVQRIGQVFDAGVEFNPRPEWNRVRQTTHGASYFLASDHRGNWESYAATITPLAVNLESGDRLEATIEREGERPLEAFDVFDSPVKTLEIEAGTYRWTRYAVLAGLAEKRAISGEVTYSWGGFYRGHLDAIETALLLKPAGALTLHLSLERNLGRLPEGKFTQYLHGARVELKVSSELYVSNLLQYDNESRSLGSAARLHWAFSPVGDLFLAYNHNMTRSFELPRRRWEFGSDQVVVKLQYAMRM